MGVKRGQNNFREFQKKRVDEGKRKIEEALAKIKKGMVFKDTNSLLSFLSAQTGFNRTTLWRKSSSYRSLIAEYFASQPGAAGVVVPEKATASMMNTQNLAKNAEIRNLKNEIKRLKSALENNRSAVRNNENNSVDFSTNEGGYNLPEDEIAFTSTAKSLLLVIQRLEEKELGISLDRNKMQIIDNVETGGKRVIVDAALAKRFFKWLAAGPETLQPTDRQ